VTVTVGAGVAGEGDELPVHPAQRMLNTSTREKRRNKAFFMARDRYRCILTFLSCYFPGSNRTGSDIPERRTRIFLKTPDNRC
jgi:hypothetical protein